MALPDTINETDLPLSEMGYLMSLEKALSEHFETALAPAAAEVDGVFQMGYPPISDATIGGMRILIETWLRDALNKHLLPSKEEATVIVLKAFDTWVAPRLGPSMAFLLRLGLKSLVSSLYDEIDL